MSDRADDLLEAVLRRDRFVVVTAIVLLLVLSWAWVLVGAGTGMDVLTTTGLRRMSMHMMRPATWTAGYAGLMLSMWWIMMVAMMLPSATPMLLLFARVNRKQRMTGRPYVPTAVFLAGYLAAWLGFSVIATGLQWGLEQLGLLSPMMMTTSTWLGGAILIAAGAWQLTPLKAICLRHCRSPLGFLAGNWHPGAAGAFRMGLEHGTYCLGCCWFLMGLLFFGGIMNIYWIVGLAVLVLIEKVLPIGMWAGRVIGAGLVAWGVLLIAAAA